MDQDLWLKALYFHGAPLLQTILGEEVAEKEEENEAEKEKLQMCRFIKKRLHKLFKPIDPVPDAFPAHPYPIVPFELFQNASSDDRRDLFYKSLDHGHILILRVINDNLQDNYKLLALCKPGIHMKLDDLSIAMYLPKLPAELELAGGKLESNDLIRAAVCSCSIDERKLYVTLDSNILEDEGANVKLGKITEEDLPFYVGNVDIGASSYVDYLHRHPSFNNSDWAEQLYSVLGLEKNYLYSFMDNMDGKTYAPVVYADELRKKQVLSLSNAQYAKAHQHYENGEFKEAFLCFNKALSIYPKNVEALVARGTLHSNTNNLRKAFVDMETALKIENSHVGARKQMSILLVSAARMHIEQNNLGKAQESLDAALDLDGANKDAVAAVEEIRKMKLSSTASDTPDKESVTDKRDHFNSCSSDRSDNSSSAKEKQESFLEMSTKAFLSSMKKKHLHDHDKERKSHHHRRHKSRSKSPKKK